MYLDRQKGEPRRDLGGKRVNGRVESSTALLKGEKENISTREAKGISSTTVIDNQRRQARRNGKLVCSLIYSTEHLERSHTHDHGGLTKAPLGGAGLFLLLGLFIIIIIFK